MDSFIRVKLITIYIIICDVCNKISKQITFKYFINYYYIFRVLNMNPNVINNYFNYKNQELKNKYLIIIIIYIYIFKLYIIINFIN